MTHRRFRSSEKCNRRDARSARRKGHILAALTLTASLPDGAVAGSTAATDAATVTIRVSVLAHYGLTQASASPILGDDSPANLCVRTNAARPSLPVKGAWLDGERAAFEFVLPSCADLRSLSPVGQIVAARRSEGGLLLVRPE